MLQRATLSNLASISQRQPLLQSVLNHFAPSSISQPPYIRHYDIQTAFLHGILGDDKTAYMEQPPSFESSGQEEWVMHLVKSIYGMQQAGRRWNQTFHRAVTKWGFQRIPCDWCVYIHCTPKGTVIFAIHVDDIFSIANPPEKNIRFPCISCFAPYALLPFHTSFCHMSTGTSSPSWGGVLRRGYQGPDHNVCLSYIWRCVPLSDTTIVFLFPQSCPWPQAEGYVHALRIWHYLIDCTLELLGT